MHCLQATIAEQQPQFGQVMQQLLERYVPSCFVPWLSVADAKYLSTVAASTVDCYERMLHDESICIAFTCLAHTLIARHL